RSASDAALRARAPAVPGLVDPTKPNQVRKSKGPLPSWKLKHFVGPRAPSPAWLESTNWFLRSASDAALQARPPAVPGLVDPTKPNQVRKSKGPLPSWKLKHFVGPRAPSPAWLESTNCFLRSASDAALR